MYRLLMNMHFIAPDLMMFGYNRCSYLIKVHLNEDRDYRCDEIPENYTINIEGECVWRTQYRISRSQKVY